MERLPFVGVDNNNKVLGPITEADCLNGVLHRSVTVIAFNNRGEIATQQRSRNRTLYPGMYTLSATGHVDWLKNGPEDDETAARREYKEELGKLAPDKLEHKFTTELDAPGHHIMSAVFITLDNGPFNPDPEEVQGVEFMRLERIKEIADKFTPTARMNLEKLGII